MIDLTANPNEPRKEASERIYDAAAALEQIREARKPAGAYWHRAEPNDPWELAMVTQSGAILFIGTDSKYRGEDALAYMSAGEWFRLPEPPGPGEKVGDLE